MLYTEPIVVNDKYLEFEFLSPETGEMKRYRWTMKAGRKPEAERPAYLIEQCALLSLKLKQGFNPNIHKIKTFMPDLMLPKQKKAQGIKLIEALDKVVNIKKLSSKTNGFTGVETKANVFKAWLHDMDMEAYSVYEIERGHMVMFLVHLMAVRGVQERTRYNYLTTLSTLFEDMDKNGLVDEEYFRNPCNKIPRNTKKALAATARVIYTRHQVRYMSKYLVENDAYLRDFISFIIYAFLRPSSSIRFLTVDMIDLDYREIRMPREIVKTGESDRRIIQDVLVPTIERMRLHQYPPHYYLFTRDGMPGPEHVGEDYFARRFKKVKQYMSLPAYYDMYSMRHTFATDLVRSGEKWHNIMKVTGHTTIEAFARYVRFIMAEKAVDLSDKYSLEW